MQTAAITSQPTKEIQNIVNELKAMQHTQSAVWVDTARSIPQMERQEELRNKLIVLLNKG